MAQANNASAVSSFVGVGGREQDPQSESPQALCTLRVGGKNEDQTRAGAREGEGPVRIHRGTGAPPCQNATSLEPWFVASGRPLCIPALLTFFSSGRCRLHAVRPQSGSHARKSKTSEVTLSLGSTTRGSGPRHLRPLSVSLPNSLGFQISDDSSACSPSCSCSCLHQESCRSLEAQLAHGQRWANAC